jgi:hypothetical protein
MVLRRVGPVSCAKIAALLYALAGLLIGAMLSLVSLAGGMAAGEGDSAILGALLGVGAIIVLPILYGCLGFIATLIGAWLYNFAAARVGGIEVDLS